MSSPGSGRFGQLPARKDIADGRSRTIPEVHIGRPQIRLGPDRNPTRDGRKRPPAVQVDDHHGRGRISHGSPKTGSPGKLDDATRGVQKRSPTRQPTRQEVVRDKGPTHGVKSVGGMYGGMMGRLAAKENQDNFFVHERANESGNDFYVGVVDGHGQQGKEVSTFLRNKLGPKGWQAANTDKTEVENTLAKRFSETADELRRSGIECSESGSTAVTALKRGNDLYVANVGDSRCVLAREGEGGRLEALPMSIDHKPDRKDERERILKNRGVVEPIRAFNGRYVGPARVWTKKQVAGGLAVSRAFGDIAMAPAGVVPDPEIKKETLTDKDKFVVLGSDGVWEHLSNQQVIDIAKQHRDPRQASDAIVQEARKQWQKKGQGYVDDITALVMKV